jgi:hypothetical protein
MTSTIPPGTVEFVTPNGVGYRPEREVLDELLSAAMEAAWECGVCRRVGFHEHEEQVAWGYDEDRKPCACCAPLVKLVVPLLRERKRRELEQEGKETA